MTDPETPVPAPAPAAAVPLGRSLAMILPAALGAIVPFWMSVPLTALLLERQGFGTAAIGLFAALPWLALLLAGPLLPRLVGRLGPTRAVLLGIALSAAAFAAFLLSSHPAAWFAGNAVLGLGVGLEWIVADAWVLGAAPARSRGRVLGAYQILATGAMGAGPALLALTGVGPSLPFLAGLGLLAAAAAWLLAWRAAAGSGRLVPPVAPERGRSATLLAVVRLAPVPVAAAFAGGVLETANASVLPLYGVAAGGLDPARVPALATAAALGGVALQYPLGRLADSAGGGGRGLAAGLAAGVLAGLAALPLAVTSFPALLALLALWGGLVNGLYTAATVQAGARAGANGAAAAVTAVALSYTAGGVVGPWLAGAGFEGVLPPHGMVPALALPVAALLALAVLRGGRRARGGAAESAPSARL